MQQTWTSTKTSKKQEHIENDFGTTSINGGHFIRPANFLHDIIVGKMMGKGT